MGSMLKQTPLAEHRAQAKYPVHRMMKKKIQKEKQEMKIPFLVFPSYFRECFQHLRVTE